MTSKNLCFLQCTTSLLELEVVGELYLTGNGSNISLSVIYCILLTHVTLKNTKSSYQVKWFSVFIKEAISFIFASVCYICFGAAVI